MWCIAEMNAEYIARMEDVLALYEKPLSEKEPVVCMDEKPVVLHADVRPPRPMRPGRVARRDCEYRRRGTANAFCGVQPKAGRHFTKVTPNRSAPQFADYLLQIVAAYPEADTIHLVMDNLSSHRRKALVDRYGERIGGLLWDRFTVHYTPKHGSWLNQAEIEISLFSRECLGIRRIPSLRDLSREAQAWNRKMNRDQVVINWKFTRKKARQKFGYKETNSGCQRPSHSSQGQTADRVLIHVDTDLGAKVLLNSRMAYVAVSRGAHDARIFTNNTSALGQELSRDVSHTPAIHQALVSQSIEQQHTHMHEIGEGFGLAATTRTAWRSSTKVRQAVQHRLTLFEALGVSPN
jgi:transposase